MFHQFDLENDPDFQEYKQHVIDELIPKVRDTDIFISLTPSKTSEVDVKFAVELGIAILLDKPILAIVPPKFNAPKKFKKIVDHFVELDLMNPEERMKLSDVIEQVVTQPQPWMNQESNPEERIDVEFAIKIGLLVMYDKPMIVGIVPGSKMSNKFSKIVDSFVEVNEDDNPFQIVENIEQHEGFRAAVQELRDNGTIYDPWNDPLEGKDDE